MAKRSRLTDVLVGTVLAIAVFSWIVERTGWGILAFIAATVSLCFLFISMVRKSIGNRRFNKLVIATLSSPRHWKEEQQTNLVLARMNFEKASVLHELQILRNSLHIALSSKNMDVARSRMELACESLEDIKRSRVVDRKTLRIICDTLDDAMLEFQTVSFINAAKGHIEKAAMLKTEKAKRRHLHRALEVLDEGIANRKSDKLSIQKMKDKVLSLM